MSLQLETKRFRMRTFGLSGSPQSRMLFILALAVFVSLITAASSSAEAKQRGEIWIGTWATAPQPFMPGALQNFRNQTLRLIVHTSAGGAKARIKISNIYGDQPLLIGAAHIARRKTRADIDSTSDRTLKFGGQTSTTIPPRSMVVSDPVDLQVPPLSDLAVSLFLPTATEATTSHILAMQTSYVSPGTRDSSEAGTVTVSKETLFCPIMTGLVLD